MGSGIERHTLIGECVGFGSANRLSECAECHKARTRKTNMARSMLHRNSHHIHTRSPGSASLTSHPFPPPPPSPFMRNHKNNRWHDSRARALLCCSEYCGVVFVDTPHTFFFFVSLCPTNSHKLIGVCACDSFAMADRQCSNVHNVVRGNYVRHTIHSIYHHLCTTQRNLRANVEPSQPLGETTAAYPNTFGYLHVSEYL